MPMPVLHHVRAAGEVGEGEQAQLPVVRRPLREALCLRFQNIVVPPFQATRKVAAERELRARERVLRGMIDVATYDVQKLCARGMVDVRLYAVTAFLPAEIEIVSDKLVLALVFAHQARLPGKKPRDQSAAEFFEFAAEAGVDRARHVGEILPIGERVAPIVQPERGVECLHGAEFFLEVLHKPTLHPLPRHAVVFGLVVQLIAYDGGMILDVLHQSADGALAVKEIVLVGDVHLLASTVFLPALGGGDHDVRVLFDHPCRDGIRRRADNDADPRLAHGAQNAVQMSEIELAVARFGGAPRRFEHPHDVDARPLHHLHVLLQPFVRHVFVVIRDPVTEFFHALLSRKI